jgi:hypothetical protein
MSVRVKGRARVQDADQSPEYTDSSFDQREVTVDGQTYHFGPNETRNFLDDGIGIAVAAFVNDGIVEDVVPFGDAKS